MSLGIPELDEAFCKEHEYVLFIILFPTYTES
jgi:hypothetical protein